MIWAGVVRMSKRVGVGVPLRDGVAVVGLRQRLEDGDFADAAEAGAVAVADEHRRDERQVADVLLGHVALVGELLDDAFDGLGVHGRGERVAVGGQLERLLHVRAPGVDGEVVADLVDHDEDRRVAFGDASAGGRSRPSPA